MISHYLHQKIRYKINRSFFSGAQYGKTTIFIVKDVFLIRDFFEDTQQMRHEFWHIIDISQSNELKCALDDRNSYLECSSAHFDYEHCVLRLHGSFNDGDHPEDCSF